MVMLVFDSAGMAQVRNLKPNGVRVSAVLKLQLPSNLCQALSLGCLANLALNGYCRSRCSLAVNSTACCALSVAVELSVVELSIVQLVAPTFHSPLRARLPA